MDTSDTVAKKTTTASIPANGVLRPYLHEKSGRRYTYSDVKASEYGYGIISIPRQPFVELLHLHLQQECRGFSLILFAVHYQTFGGLYAVIGYGRGIPGGIQSSHHWTQPFPELWSLPSYRCQCDSTTTSSSRSSRPQLSHSPSSGLSRSLRLMGSWPVIGIWRRQLHVLCLGAIATPDGLH